MESAQRESKVCIAQSGLQLGIFSLSLPSDGPVTLIWLISQLSIFRV